MQRPRRSFGERVALQDVTVSLEEGGTLVVFGPNGAGKSTLLRVLATLLRPHAGTARVLGRELPGDGWAVRGRIGFVGHEPLLYRELTGAREPALHARAARGRRRADRGTAGARGDEAACRRAGAHAVARDGPALAICRAMLHDPELLLLDEPLRRPGPGGDRAGRAAIVHGRRLACVTSHDPERGLHDADLALGLRGGRPAFVAPAGEVDAAAIRELYR